MRGQGAQGALDPPVLQAAFTRAAAAWDHDGSFAARRKDPVAAAIHGAYLVGWTFRHANVIIDHEGVERGMLTWPPAMLRARYLEGWTRRCEEKYAAKARARFEGADVTLEHGASLAAARQLFRSRAKDALAPPEKRLDVTRVVFDLTVVVEITWNTSG